VLLQHLEQLALGQLDAVEQRLGAGVRLLAQLRVERAQRALHVVGDRDNVAREGRDAVQARVGDLALGSPAQILHFGERAKELVLVVRTFLRQRFDQGCNLGFIGRPGGVGFCPRRNGGTAVRIRHHIVPTSVAVQKSASFSRRIRNADF
jgi:hypothetical protein